MRRRASSPRGIEKHLVLIRVELAHGETAAARQPAKRVRKPRSQPRDVVECQHVPVIGRDEQFPLFSREGPDRGWRGQPCVKLMIF